jgi:hypothetical protein
MPPRDITPSEIQKQLALLEATPGRIAACADGLDETRLRESPSKRVWSAVEVLAHLRACADLWSYSIYAMLAEATPTLALLDERRWSKALYYADRSFANALQREKLERAQLIHVLRDLPYESWMRAAVIAERRHTVFSQARRMALHEAEHCNQLETLLSQEV